MLMAELPMMETIPEETLIPDTDRGSLLLNGGMDGKKITGNSVKNENIGCNGIYSVQTEEVGKYKAKLVVTEQTENALTNQKEISFEVDNKVPTVSGNAFLEKKVTIMGITDKILKGGEDPGIEEAVRKLMEEDYDVTYKSFRLIK